VPDRRCRNPSGAATAPGTKVFLLLFLQKKKQCYFFKKEPKNSYGLATEASWLILQVGF
jgi:hypothetical protein